MHDATASHHALACSISTLMPMPCPCPCPCQARPTPMPGPAPCHATTRQACRAYTCPMPCHALPTCGPVPLRCCCPTTHTPPPHLVCASQLFSRLRTSSESSFQLQQPVSMSPAEMAITARVAKGGEREARLGRRGDRHEGRHGMAGAARRAAMACARSPISVEPPCSLHAQPGATCLHTPVPGPGLCGSSAPACRGSCCRRRSGATS